MSERNGRNGITRKGPYMQIREIQLPNYVYDNLMTSEDRVDDPPVYEQEAEVPLYTTANGNLLNHQPHMRNTHSHTYTEMLAASEFEITTCMTPMAECADSTQAVTPHATRNHIPSYPGSGFEDDNAISSTMMTDSRTSYNAIPSPYQMNMDAFTPTSSTSSNGPHKRKPMNFQPNKAAASEYDMSISVAGSGCEAGSSSNTMSSQASRKRNGSSFAGSGYEDDTCDNATSCGPNINRKHNHSQIEKRRRDKMNTHINELCSLIPMCKAMSRKLDKLTVLRMAVQHLRSIRGALSAGPTAAPPRPAFISERDLNNLVLQTAGDCFLLVIGCHRGRLLYVSSSVSRLLHYNQSELLGQTVFDIVHPKDVTKVKEQLSSSDIGPREKLVDAKTMLPIKPETVSDSSRLSSGARRSFFCRIKCKYPQPEMKVEDDGFADVKDLYAERRYCIVHCTGYLKSWCSSEISETPDMDTNECGNEEADGSVSCLVAVGRALHEMTALPPGVNPDLISPDNFTFISRHTIDGKFIFVDQRCTVVLGYLPQEMLGTSLYEYVKEPELSQITQNHRGSLTQVKPVLTIPYSFKRKDGVMVLLQTIFKSFRNPWNKDVEYIVANNFYIRSSNYIMNGLPAIYDIDDDSETDLESLAGNQNLCSALADNTMDHKKSPLSSPCQPVQMQPEVPIFKYQPNVMETIIEEGIGTSYSQVRNNVPLTSTRPPSPLFEVSSIPEVHHSPLVDSTPPVGIGGDCEADMATVMSLLEADAGICPSIDLSSLPWEGI